MPKVTIDGREIEVEAGLTILQAAERLGIEIPRFCYHDRLSIAGNCRMCLVDVEKAPKPIASCAWPVADGMVVRTRSEIATKARNGVMEFLLINHPLDCPICDQGGECDLQDQAMAYGRGFSRYGEHKRAIPAKTMGPLIRTYMTRCIHCTRCIRFATEIAGVPEMGALGRGEHMEITTHLEGALHSELSANIIDLCPVGALTSAPYAYVARPWELKKTESIDVMDAVGSNIRVDSRGSEVLRVLPRLNEEINEEWISDKTRYACDGLRLRRLDRPYVRRDGRLEEASWQEAFETIAFRLQGLDGKKIAAVAGDQADCEAMAALKDLMTGLGSPHIDCRQDGAKLDPANPAGWRFNTTIAGIEQADALLMVGTNPRWEGALVNARIRKRWLRGGFLIGVIGEAHDLTYRYDHLGEGGDALRAVADGSHDFAKVLKDTERPMVVLGMGALTRSDGAAVLAMARKIADQTGMVAEGWNGFNLLHTAAARVGGMELGFVPGEGGRDVEGILAGAESGQIEAVYLLAADEIDTARLEKPFVIYQGHHGDRGADCADVILPGAAYTEKHALYVNTEGRAQRARLSHFPPGEAREDWKILRALSATLDKTLPYDTLEDLRARLAKASPVFAAYDRVVPAAWGAFGAEGPVDAAPFATPIADFYRTDPISRASATMAECAEVIAPGPNNTQEKTGTDG